MKAKFLFNVGAPDTFSKQDFLIRVLHHLPIENWGVGQEIRLRRLNLKMIRITGHLFLTYNVSNLVEIQFS